MAERLVRPGEPVQRLLQGAILVYELETSRFQALLLSRLASGLAFSAETGAAAALPDVSDGPYDQRLGYTRLPSWVRSLAKRGFEVDRQARSSWLLRALTHGGLFAIYPEKTRAGLRVLSREEEPLYEALFPEEVFPDLESVPPILIESLLFIENREIFEGGRYRNPAVEWDRLAAAAYEKLLEALGFRRSAAGGSTLAVQIEKFRHSPEGRTADVRGGPPRPPGSPTG